MAGKGKRAPTDKQRLLREIVEMTEGQHRLGLVSDDQMAFARNTLAPLVKPGTTVCADLKRDIFGQ